MAATFDEVLLTDTRWLQVNRNHQERKANSFVSSSLRSPFTTSSGLSLMLAALPSYGSHELRTMTLKTLEACCKELGHS